MKTPYRKEGSPNSASPPRKQSVKVVSEEEVFSSAILPIEDPSEEKNIIERRKIPYSLYLILKLGAKSMGYTEKSVHNRIREVYRLCFDAKGKEDMKVINDFVAFHPDLVFDTPWLVEVVHNHTVFDEPGQSSYRTRLLQASGYGFKRAAGNPSKRRWQKASWIDSQRELLKSFEQMLKQFYKSGDWNLYLSEWKEVAVPKKADDLIRQYPVLKKCSGKLKEHLRRRQFRKAALLIVSTLWGVGKRNLDGKSGR